RLCFLVRGHCLSNRLRHHRAIPFVHTTRLLVPSRSLQAGNNRKWRRTPWRRSCHSDDRPHAASSQSSTSEVWYGLASGSEATSARCTSAGSELGVSQ